MKEINWESRLWKVSDAKTDKAFLNRLSKWVFDLTGNVNVTMRLKTLSIKEK